MASRKPSGDIEKSQLFVVDDDTHPTRKLSKDPLVTVKPFFSSPQARDRSGSSNSSKTLFPSRAPTLHENENPKPKRRSTSKSQKPSKVFDLIERILTWVLVPEVFHIGIFLTAIYSTALSTLWFLIAVIKPHWGNFIANNGSISPTVASIIIAALAKTIEMSFTTVIIACLGQHLTIKAKGAGITVNDLQLKNMILLPCALVTQKKGFRALWRSGFLGFICIMAYISATFFTTASDAVVSPRLSITPLAATNLSAYLQTSIANTFHIGQSCPNPPKSIQNANTCVTTEHAGLSFRNYLQYLSNWQLATSNGRKITYQSKPLPSAAFSDSVAVQGQWLYPVDYRLLSTRFGRLITGTHMAMPFAGVINATSIPENKLNVVNQGTGQLTVNARAVSPVVGVTCAVVTAQELVPIVYSNWSHPAEGPMSPAVFENTYKNETWRTNATAFDEVFQFNNESRQRPVFYSLPIQYNTQFDGEGTYRDMLYILMNSNISASAAVDKGQYTLCGMNFTLMGGCSSVYTANNSGTALTLNCDKGNEMAFPRDKVAVVTSPKDWVSVAAVWGRSISLGAGITNSNSALAAILTQLAPTNDSFDPRQPSLADSLAILSAGTLLQSTVDTPFDGFWPFNLTVGGPNNLLPKAVIQKFQANIQVSDYSSGFTNDWKIVFVVELLLVVIMNVGCLAYLTYLTVGRLSISRKLGLRRIAAQRLQEDITELREVFNTAISSPAVSVLDAPDEGRTIRWRYQNATFRPTNFASLSKVNGRTWFQYPAKKEKANGWL